ncbi:MAG: helix-turn-helix domain-containing protein [Planctomycetes bacterium]|nr:helix-turn-helix domain-containing protein [Planctomycetota bacterium]
MTDVGRLLDDIRAAIAESGKTRYRIAQDTGISQAQLSRLMSGKRGLSLDALEKLADALGWEVVIRRRRRRARGKG